MKNLSTPTFLVRFFSQPLLVVLVAVLAKIPILLTGNIQEDSFITWRVARNLVEYGSIGFNGAEKISASTTHLYLLISAVFRFVFSDYFIFPLLLFSSFLFAVGSWWLGKLLFPENVLKVGVFVFLLNLAPPALTASALGMEYGILFFLYCALLYWAIGKNKNWAYIIFPVLLLWTRIDTVIFLGVFFMVDLYLRKKLNFYFILGGLIGVISVVTFNYLYFGELVNHTITAKKIAYKTIMQSSNFSSMLYQWAYYGGLIKKYSIFTLLIWLAFLVALCWGIFRICRDEVNVNQKTKIILLGTVVFAVLKISAFAYLKAYFDWYYWLPRVFLFSAVLFYFLRSALTKKTVVLLTLVFFGLYGFQILQSYAIGYMENSQRRTIAADINKVKTNEQSILLEPAGIIPYYTNLYTYDEVGLVNKRITDEMQKDEKFWWINAVQKYHPTYIVTVGKQAGDPRFYPLHPEDAQRFGKEYPLLKTYSIAKVHENAPLLLRWIYQIRPIGKDYYLYKSVD